MKSVGIDPATHTGMALIGSENDQAKVIELQKIRGFHRLQLLAQSVDRTLDVWKPDVVVIEAYAYSKNVDSFITIVECGTVIKELLYCHRIPWVEVPPTILKKWFTGKGNASKEQMADSAKLLGFSSWSHDVIDAWALARMGQLEEADLSQMSGVELFGF